MNGYMRAGRYGNPHHFEMEVVAGVDPATGRRRRVHRSFTGSREDAEAALAELVAEVDASAVRRRPWDVRKGRWRPRRARTAVPRPYPLGDLLRVLDGSVDQLAPRLGVPARTLHRWRHTGLTVDQADMLACRAGLHPGEVWPDW